MVSNFILSLDFEMFWGVSDTRTIFNYGNAIKKVPMVVEKTLSLFSLYGISATWATVGMMMHRDFHEWRESWPTTLPHETYANKSNYSLLEDVRNFPELFFAPDLVSKIRDTERQDIGSHTFAHIFCGDEAITSDVFEHDIIAAKEIASQLNLQLKSFVFPRNQVVQDFFPVLARHGINRIRTNLPSKLYQNGHKVPFGHIGRATRYLDSFYPISSNVFSKTSYAGNCILNTASLFLRPNTGKAFLDELRVQRILKVMTAAAREKQSLHLWWHPHNFGHNTLANLHDLEVILKHFKFLQDRYGMQSINMAGLT